MSQTLKVMGGAAALITAALVGGTLIGSALAAGDLGSPDAGTGTGTDGNATDAAAYCQTFLNAFADELGVSADEIGPAAKAAAIAAVNEAVDNGDLTEAQGAAAIERINAADGSGCGWIGLPFGRWAHHGERVEFMQGMFEAAAGELGLTTAELREALADATLEEVAAEEGVPYADVVAAALASAKADLDAAVEAGTITQEQADTLLERLETWLNDGGPGNWGDGPGGRHFHRGPIFGPWGPPDASDSSDSEDSSSGDTQSESDAEGTSA